MDPVATTEGLAIAVGCGLLLLVSIIVGLVVVSVDEHRKARAAARPREVNHAPPPADS